MTDKNWIIYSLEHSCFWRANASGYTRDIAKAGRYTKAEAESRCNMRDPQRDGLPSEVALGDPDAIDRLAGALAWYEERTREAKYGSRSDGALDDLEFDGGETAREAMGLTLKQGRDRYGRPGLVVFKRTP